MRRCDALAEIAVVAARRAILRRGTAGDDLPSAHPASWRAVEITSDPSEMAIK